MAFHFSNLGAESARIQAYADENGMVPEPGDWWQDFHWDLNLRKQFAEANSGEAAWQSFVTQAEAHTQLAENKLQDLEWSNTWH